MHSVHKKKKEQPKMSQTSRLMEGILSGRQDNWIVFPVLSEKSGISCFYVMERLPEKNSKALNKHFSKIS